MMYLTLPACHASVSEDTRYVQNFMIKGCLTPVYVQNLSTHITLND